jgi:phenylalanyl-tRNA synthetase beta chain
VGNIASSVYKSDPLITNVSVFDCFDLNITHKSIGISVTLDAVNRTLTEDEAQAVSAKIIAHIENAGGELRGKK